MTIDEIEPDCGGLYRHRRTGQIARLVYFKRPSGPGRTQGVLVLEDDSGFQWAGGLPDFWGTWLHASARHNAPGPPRSVASVSTSNHTGCVTNAPPRGTQTF